MHRGNSASFATQEGRAAWENSALPHPKQRFPWRKRIRGRVLPGCCLWLLCAPDLGNPMQVPWDKQVPLSPCLHPGPISTGLSGLGLKVWPININRLKQSGHTLFLFQGWQPLWGQHLAVSHGSSPECLQLYRTPLSHPWCLHCS